MSDGLLMSTEDLLSKFGFNDGDVPDELWDILYRAKISMSIEIWENVLRKLVRKHLLPLLPDGTEAYDIASAHNPIRVDEFPTGSKVSDLIVDIVVPWDIVVNEIISEIKGHL